MAGPSVVRGGLLTAIVPEGPALVYSPTRTVGIRESRRKYSSEGELNFANLASAASQLGLHPVGLDADRAALHDLPMPAIVQVHDPKYPDELPHFLVLLRPEADGVRLLDAPYPDYFLPEDRFQQSWTGKIMVFASDEQEAQQIHNNASGSNDLRWIIWGLVAALAVLIGLLSVTWRPRYSKIGILPATESLKPHAVGIIKRPTLLIVCLLFVLIASVFSLGFFAIFHRDKNVSPCCEFDKQVMDLGELTPGMHNIHVPIKNSGNKPLHITQAISSCSCCAIVQRPDLILPEQNAAIETQLTVTPGTRTIQLTVESNDPEGSKHLLLYWHGKTQPTLLPRRISATNVPLDHSYERTIKLIYPGGKSALVPHLKDYQCDRQGVEVHEGRNDPLSSKFTTLGLLTNIIGEMELHCASSRLADLKTSRPIVSFS